jgi:FixJ family two-component response regulator
MQSIKTKSGVISIVDDDEIIRAALSSFARSFGLTAYAFSSAEEFLQSPHLAETSCLISDVQMPDLNGIELQRILGARGQRIPIIFLTGFPDENVEVQAMTAGALCYLTKPFDEEQLLKYVDQALAIGGTARPRS